MAAEAGAVRYAGHVDVGVFRADEIEVDPVARILGKFDLPELCGIRRGPIRRKRTGGIRASCSRKEACRQGRRVPRALPRFNDEIFLSISSHPILTSRPLSKEKEISLGFAALIDLIGMKLIPGVWGIFSNNSFTALKLSDPKGNPGL